MWSESAGYAHHIRSRSIRIFRSTFSYVDDYSALTLKRGGKVDSKVSTRSERRAGCRLLFSQFNG